MSDNQKDKIGIHIFIGAVGLISVAGLVVAIIANDKARKSDSGGNDVASTPSPTFTTVISGAISTEVLNIVKPSARNGVAESTTVYTLPTAAGKAGQVITLGADARKAVWASSGASSVSGPATSVINSIATFSDVSGNTLDSSTINIDTAGGINGIVTISGKSDHSDVTLGTVEGKDVETTGNVNVKSGPTTGTGGTSGNVSVYTGIAAAGTSGDISIYTGKDGTTTTQGTLNIGTATQSVPVVHSQEYERWLSNPQQTTGTIQDYPPLVVIANNSSPAATLTVTLQTPGTEDIGKIITILNVGNTTTPDEANTITISKSQLAGGTNNTVDKVVLPGYGVKCIAVSANTAGWCVL